MLIISDSYSGGSSSNDGCLKILMAEICEYEGPIDKFTGDRLGYLLMDLTHKLDMELL